MHVQVRNHSCDHRRQPGAADHRTLHPPIRPRSHDWVPSTSAEERTLPVGGLVSLTDAATGTPQQVLGYGWTGDAGPPGPPKWPLGSKLPLMMITARHVTPKGSTYPLPFLGLANTIAYYTFAAM